MNLRQLRTLCEVVDRRLRISEAAEAVYRSQPSVTRQIQELEREFGFDIFVRKHNKILAITPQGKEIVAIARNMLQEAENMHRIGRDIAKLEQGDFTIATTHTQARYIFPQVMQRFLNSHPNVSLNLRQGNPKECCDLVALGHADVAICTDTAEPLEDVAKIPCYRLSRSVITPVQHPLLRVKPLTLEALGRYPLITYGEAYNGRRIVNQAFSAKGLTPRIVLSAMDADVIKAGVGMGLGIAILATVAFDPNQDTNLRRIDARHLFKPSIVNLILRRGNYLREYMIAFLLMFAPKLRRTDIEGALSRKTPRTLPRVQPPEL